MIDLEEVNLWIGKAHILKDISLSVKTGQTLALVGQSGAGKTSLARLLLRLIEGHHLDAHASRRSKVRWSGRASFGDIDLLRASERQMSRLRGHKIGLVVQGLSDALNPQLTVRTHIQDILTRCRINTQNPADVCDAFNIPQRLLNHRPAELSGGETQRILTALAILPDPDLLIIDEPTASLDRDNRQSATKILTTYANNRAQILISHDDTLVSHLADRTVRLVDGRIKADTSLTKPKSTQQPVAVKRHSHTSRAANIRNKQPLLEVRSVSHAYGGRQVLSNVNFQIGAGECLCIRGESGSGKSTLSRLVSGFLPLQTGQIMCPLCGRGRRYPIGFVSQLPHRSLAPHFTVAQTLAESMYFVRGKRANERIISEALRAVGLPTHAVFQKKLTRSLSGGEAQRLSQARSLIFQPQLLIADEPTSALDSASKDGVLSTLLRAKIDEGLAILLFTHDDDTSLRLADRVMFLSGQGDLTARGV